MYKQTQKEQNWLLPLLIKDMIPVDHVCFLVEDFVEGLDYGKFDMIYAGAGGVKIEMNLISIAHNLGKIWRIRQGIGC